MARPERNTVDYFPHLISDGKKMFSIENKYKNDGYATWFKILEKLATTEFHYLDLNDEGEIMYLAAKCHISEQTLLSIITDLTRLSVFDKMLWENKIIWCQSFIDSIQDAYYRRNNKCMNYDSLCKHLKSLGYQLLGLSKSSAIKKPQTILEDSKLNKTILKDIPTIEEFEEYFKSKDADISLAKKAYDHYAESNWHDSKGNKVVNWKQKVLTNWINKTEKKNGQQKSIFS